jgi:hypothetical protein
VKASSVGGGALTRGCDTQGLTGIWTGPSPATHRGLELQGKGRSPDFFPPERAPAWGPHGQGRPLDLFHLSAPAWERLAAAWGRLGDAWERLGNGVCDPQISGTDAQMLGSQLPCICLQPSVIETAAFALQEERQDGLAAFVRNALSRGEPGGLSSTGMHAVSRDGANPCLVPRSYSSCRLISDGIKPRYSTVVSSRLEHHGTIEGASIRMAGWSLLSRTPRLEPSMPSHQSH